MIMQADNFTLTLDTVSLTPSVSLFYENREVDSWTGMEKASDNVLTSVLYLLKKHNLRMRDISKLIVTVGPGSLTGIRIGLATAKGLSFGSKVKCIGVSNLSALAAYAFASSEAETARVFIVGSQQRVVFQDFLRTSDLSFISTAEPQLLMNSDLLNYLGDQELNIIYCRKEVNSITEQMISKYCRDRVIYAPSTLSKYAFIASLNLPVEVKPLYISDVAFRKIT